MNQIFGLDFNSVTFSENFSGCFYLLHSIMFALSFFLSFFHFFLSFFLSFFPLWVWGIVGPNNVVTSPLPVKSPGHPFLSLPSCSSVFFPFVLFFFCLDAWPKFQCCPRDPCPSFVANIFFGSSLPLPPPFPLLPHLSQQKRITRPPL